MLASMRAGEGERLLAIGAFSMQCGLSIATLRRYDEAGLLPAAYVDADSGYRYYRPDQVRSGHLIRLLRALDVPVAEISELLRAPDPQTAVARLEGHWREVERRVAEGRRISAFIRRSLGGAEFSMFPVQLKDVPDQTVLGRRRVVAIAELEGYIYDTLDQLRTEADRCALPVAGPGLTLYYSKVDDETDGEVQVCLPVRAGERAPDGLGAGITLDHLPGGTVAYTIASGPETEYPAILGAYDAVAEWSQANGRVLSGPPREIAHDPERLEVAWLLHDA